MIGSPGDDDERLRWVVAPAPSLHGVGAVVDGLPVRAWSDDATLDASPEAWPTAFCLPAARARAVLVVERDVDPAWRAGVDANLAQAAAWWAGDPRLRLEVAPNAAPPPTTSAADGRGLCFTGGVDSFFSLLTDPVRPTHLVFVVGFDVALDDTERIDASVRTVHAVADEVGATPLVIHTDLRAHPRFDAISWEHTHGAALAAMGHLAHREIGMLVIPPSYAVDRLVPWGSRPDLDPRWGVPGRLRIEHGDASGRRLDRVLAIAQHPLVQRHLRVCWQNVAGTVNCGTCEKCARTMTMLAGADALQHCATFPDRAGLPATLDGIEALGAGHLPMWLDLLDLPLRPDEAAALRRLVDRSR